MPVLVAEYLAGELVRVSHQVARVLHIPDQVADTRGPDKVADLVMDADPGQHELCPHPQRINPANPASDDDQSPRTRPLPPAPSPSRGGGAKPVFLPLSASGRGLGGGVGT